MKSPDPRPLHAKPHVASHELAGRPIHVFSQASCRGPGFCLQAPWKSGNTDIRVFLGDRPSTDRQEEMAGTVETGGLLRAERLLPWCQTVLALGKQAWWFWSLTSHLAAFPPSGRPIACLTGKSRG